MNSNKGNLYVVAGLLVLLEVAVRLGVISKLYFPAPTSILTSLIEDLVSGQLIGHVVTSLVLLIIGLFLSCVLSIILAMLSEKSKRFQEVCVGLSSIASPIPGAAILPLFIIWFGIGTSASLAVIMHAVVWPYYKTLHIAMKSQPPIYKQVAQAYGIKGLRKFLLVDAYAILASALDGFRAAWARAWRALITTEMIFGAIGNSGGIGWYIFKSRVFMDTSRLYAGLLIVVLIGYLTETYLFDLIESKTLVKWGMMEASDDRA
ncbi:MULTISPECIES: ABC transporter permease [unclassified Fusibacter]|uniref:ABC transporter permease n=1 Tax=unclassified Fusibacter TaxID=2624464 RepID=UPI0013E93E75|nr:MULTISPECIES: ABC transporter permease subunit [unclassified Fusibacter]MCK8058186.1 ABC transporter permease subunit [Fusibacter sp. A2]NPE20769.1 ABC transporter permease subunit [Fusibacter sp. A1]